MNIFLSDEARAAAKAKAVEWNLKGSGTAIPMDAAVDIAQAVTNSEQGWHDAGRDLLRAINDLLNARTPLDLAMAISEVHNHRDSLATWFPEYDYEAGVESVL